ncbi:hypothetical protein [Pseudomonas rustica]
MTYLKKAVALLATLAALSAPLAIHAEESGAFVERNESYGKKSSQR